MGGAYSTHGEMRNAYLLVGKPKGKNSSEDLCIDGMIILKRILRKQGEGIIGFIWHRIGTGSGLL
jgi:hypothetical protein